MVTEFKTKELIDLIFKEIYERFVIKVKFSIIEYWRKKLELE